MKRIVLFFIFFILFIIQYSDFVFAAYPPATSFRSLVVKLDQKIEARVQVAFSDIDDVARDYGYQPHLCREIWGHQHTQDCDDAATGIRLADASETGVQAPEGDDLEDDLDDEEDIIDDPFGDDEEVLETIADPLEPINRFFFHFNDKLYSWVLRPVAKGYSAVVPKSARICVRNFFHNIAFPIRFVNCLLQAKFNSAMVELSRFITNSIVGLAGFFDVATTKFELNEQEEDFGQTLGKYGFGPGFYINWPIFGPSSLRDTFGMAGDFFLDPWNQVDLTTEENIGIYTYDKVNSTSLSLGEYEDMKKAALDPYVAIRDAYFHYRKNKIKE
ncbi:MAG: VacJ family lipoprotein [Deltaproteobacteria bacterium]|nr:VacJ family lipoprotein [Deltaproteobacteria bacterium]